MINTVDGAFMALPLDEMADAALSTARRLGASHAEFRLERLREQDIGVRDHAVDSKTGSESLGFGVRVIVDGAWGFAAGYELRPAEAARVARQAVSMAVAMRGLQAAPVVLAPEPAHQGTYVSSYQINPFDVPDAEKVGFLLAVTAEALRSDTLTHADFSYTGVEEIKFLATSEGTRVVQQRVRVEGDLTGTLVTDGGMETMRTINPAIGRGWEQITTGYDFMAAARELPELLAEKMRAPSVTPGRANLVIHPSMLWLCIHESVAHATELDRVLGYEAAYAGTSWVPRDGVGSLVYGSPLMNITGDRLTEHGLSTVGWDDEGVAGQQWHLIKDGVLNGYQLDRHMAHGLSLPRSNGCAFADSFEHVPIQRMPNVSLQPGPFGTDLVDLVRRAGEGYLLLGDNSWSIDMQRYNAQFSAQQAWRIEGGRVTGQVKDLVFQFRTPDFWRSLAAVGGPETYVLHGAMNCGKGQPGQVAPVSHGAPAALFTDVKILNAREEGGK